MPRTAHQRKILGETLRQQRIQLEMSQELQELLAQKANLHHVWVGKIERGEQWISLHALLRTAAALGVRVRDLVTEF